MKTLEQLTRERDELLRQGETEKDPKERKKLARQLVFLSQLIKYMKTGPNEECLKAQLELVKKKMIRLQEEAMFGLGVRALPKQVSEYVNGKGMPNLKNQLKNLEYLLT